MLAPHRCLDSGKEALEPSDQLGLRHP
jgi:hypothetical protein